MLDNVGACDCDCWQPLGSVRFIDARAGKQQAACTILMAGNPYRREQMEHSISIRKTTYLNKNLNHVSFADASSSRLLSDALLASRRATC